MARTKKLGTEAIGFPERLDTHVADLIFVKGRDRTANPEEIRHNAFNNAINHTIPNEISGPDALGEARAAFDDLYCLSNIVLNADLTIAFQSDQTGPLPTLYEKIFFSVKRIFRIKRGKLGPTEEIVPNLDLKREFLLARLRADLLEAFQTVCKDEAERQTFVRELLTDAECRQYLTNEILGRPSGVSPPRANASTTDLPTFPRWKDRSPGDTPDSWLRTHYKPYIDAGRITRGFFQRPGEDKAFANALLAWERENKLPADLYIPTRAELVTRQLRDMGVVPDANEPRPASLTPEVSDRLRAGIRDGARLYQAARRRLG